MQPVAIVLGLGPSGLNAVRALAREGIAVHGVSFSLRDIGRWSHRCVVHDAAAMVGDEEAFVAWLLEFAARFPARPVVFPSSDRMALLLARHRARLGRGVRLWSTGYDVLESLISKDRLREVAARAGIESPPMIARPMPADLDAWCAAHPAPYLAKPWYVESANNPLRAKNRVFDDEAALRAFVAEHPGAPVLVQRMLSGGDGHVFNVAGVCDRNGRIVAMATKCKLVQYPPDRGVTVHGVVPAFRDRADEEPLFAAARALFAQVVFEGIFSLELVRERATGRYYLVDANLRSILSLGHYVSAGLNLLHLSYRLLCGDEPKGLAETPALRRTYWAEFWGLLGAWSRLRGTGRLGLGRVLWLRLRSRSHGIWSWSDPVPAIRYILQRGRR